MNLERHALPPLKHHLQHDLHKVYHNLLSFGLYQGHWCPHWHWSPPPPLWPSRTTWQAITLRLETTLLQMLYSYLGLHPCTHKSMVPCTMSRVLWSFGKLLSRHGIYETNIFTPAIMKQKNKVNFRLQYIRFSMKHSKTLSYKWWLPT